jgi:hypothetical protein
MCFGFHQYQSPLAAHGTIAEQIPVWRIRPTGPRQPPTRYLGPVSFAQKSRYLSKFCFIRMKETAWCRDIVATNRRLFANHGLEELCYLSVTLAGHQKAA